MIEDGQDGSGFWRDPETNGIGCGVSDFDVSINAC